MTDTVGFAVANDASLRAEENGGGFNDDPYTSVSSVFVYHTSLRCLPCAPQGHSQRRLRE